MSTKSFTLKIQSPSSVTSFKDYILVLNTKLTIANFIRDLQELYPRTKERQILVLMLQGTYRMMPRQFLRHMWDNVDYSPAVQHGIYLPNIFGGGNMIKIAYEEEEKEEGFAAKSMPTASPSPVTPKSTGVVAQNPAGTNPALVEMEKTIALLSNSKNTLPEKNTPQPKGRRLNGTLNAHRPTHANAPHEIVFGFKVADTNSPLSKYNLGFTTVQVPASGGRNECIQLLPRIKSGLVKWLDPSFIELGLSLNFNVTPRGTHIEWNENSFQWKDYGSPMGKWELFVQAYIYEN
ncbi:hypothetical protein EV426DRAFT_582790, partial [Tirmania nivea]